MLKVFSTAGTDYSVKGIRSGQTTTCTNVNSCANTKNKWRFLMSSEWVALIVLFQEFWLQGVDA